MVRHVDAIFSHGAFRPLQPLTMPEGTRVHLSVEEEGVEEGTALSSVNPAAKIRTPRLAHSKDAGDFVLEVRGNDDTSL
jgi:predicted DNA-binding antitoxin AbrB/MazE fold protein